MRHIKLNHERFNIVIVGTGGTGGNLIPPLSRLIYSYIESQKRYSPVKLKLIDGDRVELKNIYRQPFLATDVGMNKARVFAQRYSGAMGIDIAYVDHFIESGDELATHLSVSDYLPILIGCGDNNRLRCLMHDAVDKIQDIIWIDSGNEQTHGQVVMGVKGAGKTLFPFVADLYPHILQDRNETIVRHGSCAHIPIDDIASLSQHLATNLMAASHILNYVSNILLKKELFVNEVHFSTDTMYAKPKFI